MRLLQRSQNIVAPPEKLGEKPGQTRGRNTCLQREFEEEFILDSQGRRILQNVQLEEESNQAEKDRRVITKDSVTRF